MAFNFSLFSGLRSDSTVPAGSLLKASSVGANTVKGPLPFKVSARPAACSAVVNVLKVPAATAVSTMSFCAEPAAAGIALMRTLRINAKLAIFNFISPPSLFFSEFSVALLLFAVLTIENNYYRNTIKQGDSSIHVSANQKSGGRCCTGRKTGKSVKHNYRRASALCLGQEIPHTEAVKEHGAGGIGKAHRTLGGHAVKTG